MAVVYISLIKGCSVCNCSFIKFVDWAYVVNCIDRLATTPESKSKEN